MTKDKNFYKRVGKCLGLTFTEKQLNYLMGNFTIWKRQEGFTTAHIIKKLFSGGIITFSTSIDEPKTWSHRRDYLKTLYKYYLVLCETPFQKYLSNIDPDLMEFLKDLTN